MKIYETGRLLLEPFLPPLYKQVRSKLSELSRNSPDILDVGGRKSPYTIGLPAKVTLLDLPRESEIQQKLNLGIDRDSFREIKRRRSNVKEVVFGDMTCSDLPDESFEIAVAVEVLEHVEQDEKFVAEVYRVLKPGGVFLMTTPNGDWVVNKNPDHKRHYQKSQLSGILQKYFDEVSVDYAIRGGRYRRMGLKSWSLKSPLKTLRSIFGNIVNTRQSLNAEVKNSSTGTHHLFALARKVSR